MILNRFKELKEAICTIDELEKLTELQQLVDDQIQVMCETSDEPYDEDEDDEEDE